MSRRPEAGFVVVALGLQIGCGDDEPPGFRDCLEWKTSDGRGPIDGTLRQEFTGWVEGAQRVVSSPTTNYRPHGYYITTGEDPFVALGVSGCALDGEGNLWRLSTHWSIRKNAETPVPISACDDSSWPCDGNSAAASEPPPALVEGHSVLCVGADCTSGEWETFDTLWDLNPYSGSGEATEWSSSPPLRLVATVVLEPPITAWSDEPTFIAVDVTFPER